MSKSTSTGPSNAGSISIEQWLPVRDYEGRYEVSSQGRVRSLDRRVLDSAGRNLRFPATMLQQATGKRMWVALCKDGVQSRVLVHHLVAEAFHGTRPAGMLACHNDGNPFNNAASNLRWDTPSANTFDSVVHGTHPWSRRTHCKNGHEYTPENTRIDVKGPGQQKRVCRKCAAAAMKRFRASALVAVVAATAALIGLAPAPTANATPAQDSQFLNLIDGQGITYASATKVVTAAYSVCEMRASGFSEMETAQKVYEVTPLDAYNAGFFVGAAEIVYCAWYYEGDGGATAQARRLI